jgi:glucan phosphoethanolaminetransferase (alkaline phosphatase superfamily)
MKKQNEKITIGLDNKTARLSGILYLSLIPLGILGIIYIPSNLIVSGDITTTISNITENETLFRWSIISALAVQLVNIILVILLFKIFRHIHKVMAVLMVIFSLLAVPIAFINEINNLAVLQLLDHPNESEYLISVFLNLHHHGIIIAQIFWGLWLFPLGYLVYHSGYMPRFIGILLMIGCVGYVVDSFTLILLPQFKITFSEFTFLGEVIFPLYLLIKGIKYQHS